MKSKEALERLSKCHWGGVGDIDIIKKDLDKLEELVKVIRILKTRKYAEWIKNKFYDGVGYDEEQEKLFEKVFGSSWRKY